MILLEHWFILEAVILIGVFAIILLSVVRSARKQKTARVMPITIGGRVKFTAFYVMRVLGLGLGTFLLIALVVMFERNLYGVITETMPTPSDVTVPPDLPFEVEEVKFEGGDGLTMAGWRVPSTNGATIILLHGYGGNRMGMLWHAQQLVNAGYGVLMYDERASGESEGTYRSYGWEDPRDVQGAIRFIETEAGGGSERIGVAGCSTGAQIALQSAAYYPKLEGVWADGPSSARAQDIPPPKNPIMALIVLGNYQLDWMYQVKLGIEPPPPLIEVIGNIAPRPIMLVGGGTPLPLFGSENEMMLPRYSQFAGPNAQTWVVPEAVHCDGHAHRPGEYAARMVEFFDTAFGITR
ncbi:MAG: alpha/beta fold hydrolase [Anaerolineales bacterium]|nr:alpha/beta fold hydrolase [Anaerolineales bacterium]